MPLLKALQLGSAAAAAAAAAAASGQLAGSSSSSSSHLPLQSLAIASLWPPEGSGLLTHLSSNPEPYQALTHLTFLPSLVSPLGPVAEALKGLTSLQNLSSLRLKVDGYSGSVSDAQFAWCFEPLVAPLQQLTSVTKLGTCWMQRHWAQDMPEQLRVSVCWLSWSQIACSIVWSGAERTAIRIYVTRF
jgi:hypothetical protein